MTFRDAVERSDHAPGGAGVDRLDRLLVARERGDPDVLCCETLVGGIQPIGGLAPLALRASLGQTQAVHITREQQHLPALTAGGCLAPGDILRETSDILGEPAEFAGMRGHLRQRGGRGSKLGFKFLDASKSPGTTGGQMPSERSLENMANCRVVFG